MTRKEAGGKRALRAATSARTKPEEARPENLAELMAHAYALEVEASERYSEFAAIMESHNNREIGELFRKLARIEHRHGEQILERMGWVEPPPAPSGGWRWEGGEGPETGDAGDLHYLMSAHHALSIARRNEARAQAFFEDLAARMRGELRETALEFAAEEAEHVRLMDEWLARTPPPAEGWDVDPDPPRYVD